MSRKCTTVPLQKAPLQQPSLILPASPRNFENMFKSAADSGTVICIPLKNVLSDKEIEEKFIEAGLDKKFAK